jgi:hypothetical protein
MFFRIATLVTAAAAAAVFWAPPGYADPAQDQQYLNMVRSNGVSGGQDPALIAFAQQFCSPNPPPFLDTVGALYGQGVWPSQVYVLKVGCTAPTG